VVLPLAVLALLLVPALVWELKTSTLQSRWLSDVASEVWYELHEGPSDRIRFPAAGPFDQRMGYTDVPRMGEVLRERGFVVTHQARVSERFADVVDRGLFPIYPEKAQGGLILRDRHGDILHRAPSPARVYPVFDSIPELVWRSLLYIENREFLDPRYPRRNPAVEWDRFARGVIEMGLRTLGSDRSVPGGSTLATQLEKFRHSPEGRTGSPVDKLRQMGSASLRAYLDGPETLTDQRRIVREYLNSVPLAAQRNHGEVVGTADGLWAWYGTEFAEANRLLRGGGTLEERARLFRQALGLLVAHRRPSYYLVTENGRRDLHGLVDQYLRLLQGAGVAPADLVEAALATRVHLLERAPDRPPVPFVERKAANQLRAHLQTLLGLPGLYELDRYDLTARSTLDMGWQEGVAHLFEVLSDPDSVRALGFGGDRLLSSGDPSRVIYTFTLLESTPLGNVIRAQTDSYDGPLSLTQAGRLELGSTAKLRTLVTYLDIVAELHERFAGLPADSLRQVPVATRDRITRWALDVLMRDPGIGLPTLLDAAMERTYSASPAERFATGGGVQTFSNFDNTFNGRVLSVREAFRHSVNLPWIRVMRDVVHYYMFRTPGSTARILEDVNDPARQTYLARFADQEGREFLRQFYRKYQGQAAAEIMNLLVLERALGPQRTAYAFRAVAPEATFEVFAGFMQGHTPNAALATSALEALYRQSDPTPWDLNDLGYLARVHPLELWLVRYLLERPESTLQEVMDAATEVRQEVYAWLFRTRRRNAQDQRIRTILELEAFQEIHREWKRLGYPFDNIVPSFGTAIGSSGDRPLALAELVGIVQNGGVRNPVVRVEGIELARGTPFETRLARQPLQGERVMDPTVAAVVRDAMIDVVENGTGRRTRGAVTGADGRPLVIGAKTGTGDNRYRVFGPGGRLLESRAVNRTSTLAFFIGERWFGVVTAYVPGPEADRFRFTSALPAEILRVLGPVLSPLGVEGTDREEMAAGPP
jgi:membrane peptidoglycan carboxypeptidase